MPRVVALGVLVTTIKPVMTRVLGLGVKVEIIAGTTDDRAAFLATGTNKPSDDTTTFSSMLTLKLLCNRSIFASELSTYSHHINGM